MYIILRMEYPLRLSVCSACPKQDKMDFINEFLRLSWYYCYRQINFNKIFMCPTIKFLRNLCALMRIANKCSFSNTGIKENIPTPPLRSLVYVKTLEWEKKIFEDGLFVSWLDLRKFVWIVSVNCSISFCIYSKISPQAIVKKLRNFSPFVMSWIEVHLK